MALSNDGSTGWQPASRPSSGGLLPAAACPFALAPLSSLDEDAELAARRPSEKVQCSHQNLNDKPYGPPAVPNLRRGLGWVWSVQIPSEEVLGGVGKYTTAKVANIEPFRRRTPADACRPLVRCPPCLFSLKQRFFSVDPFERTGNSRLSSFQRLAHLLVAISLSHFGRGGEVSGGSPARRVAREALGAAGGGPTAEPGATRKGGTMEVWGVF